MCSTVHGSYQLSTDPPTPPTTASHPAQPRPCTCMQARRHSTDHSLPPGHLVLVGPYTPVKPKKRDCLKIHTLRSNTQFGAK